ncbi:MAG: glycine cleavage system protein GcvH [Chloroflexota bacterium]|nr:glycine cleavage system protein GcvH [Chloroflexota bacterium]
MSPEDRKYTREHEWAKVEDADAKLVSVGITHFAQDELGDIVYFDLPNAGDSVAYMQKMGEVESVKAVSDLFSPVTGRIDAVNSELVDHPELVNDDPFEAGWIMRVVLEDLGELDTLMSANEYDEYTGAS